MALALGMTVKQLLASTDSRELTEWKAFYNLQPFDLERADLRAAIVASTVANVNRRKGAPAYKPSDFMPKLPQPWQPKKTVAQRLRAALGWPGPKKKKAE